MKLPFWATREFRWLVAGAVFVGAALAVFFLRIRPDVEEIVKSRSAAQDEPRGDAFAPAEKASKLPPDPVLDGLLAGEEDALPLGVAGTAYLRLVEYTSRLDPAVLAAEASPVRYHFFTRSPGSLRGRAVLVTALFLDWKPISLSAKAGDVDLVYRLYLMDPSGREGYVADVLAPPPPELRSRSLATVEGLFLRTCIYEGLNGPVEAPLLIGREARVAPANYAAPPFETSGVMVGLVVLAVALLMILILVQRQIAARRRPPGAPVRLPGAGVVPPRPPPAVAARKAFQWRKPPRFQAAGPAPDIAALTRRQQRRMLLLTAGAFVVLIVLSAYTIYERYREPQPEPVDLTAESARWLARAGAVRQEVAAFETRAMAKEPPLEAGDRDWLKARVKVLEKSAEALQNLIISAEQADPGGLAAAIEASAGQLRRIKVWVLDAGDLLASIGQAEPGGLFLPFETARKRSQAAREALAALEKEAAPGTVARETLAARAAAVEKGLLEAREAVQKLETYLVEGLSLVDASILERIEDTLPVREELRQLGEAIARAQALLKGT